MKNIKPAAVHIALAEASNLLRSSLKSTLEGALNYKVQIDVSSGQELVKQIKASKALPDLCIIDLSMSQMNGYETLIALKQEWPEIKIIMVSKYDHELLVRKTLAAGAASFLTTECTTTLLCEAIGEVLKNGYYHTTTMSKMLLQKNHNKKQDPEITDKELQYLCLCVEDLTQKEIAQRMGVETRTVDNYRESLFAKLDIHTRLGLGQYATRSGLVNLSGDYMLKSEMLGGG